MRTLIVSMLIASASFAQTGNLLDFANRAQGTQNYVSNKYVTIAPGSSATVINYSGTPGYTTDFFLAVSGIPTGYGIALNLNVIADGQTVYNGPSQQFFASMYWTDFVNTAFGNKYVSNSANGLKTRIPIPFNSTLQIVVTNYYYSNVVIWYDLGYQTGVAQTWGPLSHLHVAWTGNYANGMGSWVAAGPFLSQDQIAPIVNLTGIGAGKLLGVYLCADGYAAGSNAFMEGPVNVSLDSAATYKSESTDGFFGAFGRFGGIPAGWSGTDSILTLKRDVPPLYAAVRFFDPALPFQNNISVTWQAGQASTGYTFTGTVYMPAAVFYYTQN